MTRTTTRTLLLSTLMLSAGWMVAAHAEYQPPTSPPADWGPVSIDLEEIDYPHPVQYLELELFGETARMAYMDVPPSGEPNGRTVYLTHGMSYYGWYWADTIDALSAEGYRVVAEDRLGWGKSSKPLIPYSWHLHADNKAALMDHLGIEQAAVIGHSMGGQMVSRFARLYPERTTHMVMVNPIGLSGHDGPAPMEPVTTDIAQPQAAGNPDRQEVYDRHLATETRRVVDWRPEFLEHVRIRFGNDISEGGPLKNAVLATNRTGDSMVGDWPLIQARSLVIGGEEDGPGYPDAVRNAAEILPNGEAHLIPGVGHNPHVEAPEILNRELIRFLAQ